jgi:hypothetical protein
MKQTFFLILTILLIASGCKNEKQISNTPTLEVYAASLFNSDQSKGEQAVWELEESYWRSAQENDTVSYRNLWDDRFIGWPGLSEPSADKKHITDWIAFLHENPDSLWRYELKNKMVRSFGDVVVVKYTVRTFFLSRITMDTIIDQGDYRIWHTWKQKGKTWQIITGMSAE